MRDAFAFGHEHFISMLAIILKDSAPIGERIAGLGQRLLDLARGG